MGSALPAQPVTFRPLGLWDALDGEAAPQGACFAMQNLITDVTTPGVIVTGRPGAQSITNFTGFSAPSTVSVELAVGTRIYGMIATNATPGYDEPFCYDTATNAFVAITGVTSGNVPLTQANTGAWVPPTMDIIGSKIIVTHPGFSGSDTNFFGVIDLATLSAPAWSSANTSTNALPSVPLAVKQFNNRAYYACENLAYYSDALDPKTITESTQFLTLGGSGSNITGFGVVGVQQTQGGILAALVAFKQEGFWEITGDISTSNFVNEGPFVPGCVAPRTIAQGPLGIGLLYMSPAGVQMITATGTVPPQPMPGVIYPFQNCLVPSRACAAFNNAVYRIALETITNPITGANGFVEYWFSFITNQWSGPHTWCSDCIVPLNNTFITVNNRAPGALYQSDVLVTSSSMTTELGSSMPYLLQSSILPEDQGMSMKAVIETQINIDFAATGKVASIRFIDATGGAVGTATVSTAGGTYWNQFPWNQANWASAIYGLRVYNVDWSAPVVYKTGSIAVLGTLTPNLRIGQTRLRTEELEYMNNQVPA